MDYNKLFSLYSDLKSRFEAQNISFITIGGQASIYYNLSEFTKDLDIGIEPKSDKTLLACLDSLREENINFSYRIGLGSPLDSRWGNWGWTSHFDVKFEDLSGRLDVFTSLPRVDRKLIFKSGPSDLNILAETKKTQREKDWDIVRTIAIRMIDSGDLRGFLHLFDPDALRDFKERGLSVPSQILELRPSLELVTKDIEKLEGALSIEKLFWQKWDKVRLRTYISASSSFYRSAKDELGDKKNAPLMEQHQGLLSLAEKLLPLNPFSISLVSDLVEEINREIFRIFPKDLEPYLPNLALIQKLDGIYNPLIVL